MPVELVQLKPVSFKAAEVEKIAPRRHVAKPKPKKLEGVTVEKKKIIAEEPEERPPKQIEEPEASNKGTSAVGGKKVRLDVKEFPFSYYLALLQSRIQANWEPPFSSGLALSKKVLIYFKIQRSGQLTNISIESGSGDYMFDQAALRAVMLANPLPPLPYDFPEPWLGVHYEFEQGH
ncbi:MAG: energy transducer TonB [bacterium]